MLIQGLYTLSLFLQKSWQGLAKASRAFSLAKTKTAVFVCLPCLPCMRRHGRQASHNEVIHVRHASLDRRAPARNDDVFGRLTTLETKFLTW